MALPGLQQHAERGQPQLIVLTAQVHRCDLGQIEGREGVAGKDAVHDPVEGGLRGGAPHR